MGDKGVSKRIKKGEVRNPLGARAHKSAMLRKSIRKFNSKQLQRVGSLIMMSSVSDLEKIRDDKKEPMIVRWSCKLILEGYERKLSSAIYEMLLDRFAGKVTEKVHHSGIPATNNTGAVLILPEKEILDDTKPIEDKINPKV